MLTGQFRYRSTLESQISQAIGLGTHRFRATIRGRRSDGHRYTLPPPLTLDRRLSRATLSPIDRPAAFQARGHARFPTQRARVAMERCLRLKAVLQPVQILGLLLAAACAPAADLEPDPGARLFVWTTDSDSVDLNFLAVLDAEPGSATYGEVLTTLPVPTTGRTRGHHTEHRMPSGGVLFANDFGTGKTYLLNLVDPDVPSIVDSFSTAGPLMSPHSFERLPNGNVLATFQNEGSGNSTPGGLAELDPSGAVVRWGSAAQEGSYVRPYSLAVVPALDRVVTGSADMRGEGDSGVVQVWRLSDLSLVATIDIPNAWGEAAEPRVLADGSTVLVSTFGCSLLRVDGLATAAPGLTRVHVFDGQGCALPVVAGDRWIQAVPEAHGLVALDVANPDAVREVSRVVLGVDDWPHWISLSPDQRRIVVTGYAGTRHRVIVVNLDPETAALTLDHGFTDEASPRTGVSFDRPSWPHGATGPGDPHGAVFSLPSAVR